MNGGLSDAHANKMSFLKLLIPKEKDKFLQNEIKRSMHKAIYPLISIKQQFITQEGKAAWALIGSKEMKA